MSPTRFCGRSPTPACIWPWGPELTLPSDPRRVYITDDPAEDSRRGLKHALVREAKRLVEEVALLDIARTDEESLTRLIEQTATLADDIGRQPSLRDVGGLASAKVEDAALLERSGISGRSNPLAPPLYLHMDDDGVTRGQAFYTAAYEGPMGCLHGGFVAAAFDDLMGFAQMASGKAGYTGTLTVKMLLPTPLYRPIDYEAGLDHVDGRKIWCWAKSWDAETQLAEASIVFISPKDGTLPR
jgi:acyl-coenzyme A thioesterase PaaI-like protein